MNRTVVVVEDGICHVFSAEGVEVEQIGQIKVGVLPSARAAVLGLNLADLIQEAQPKRPAPPKAVATPAPAHRPVKQRHPSRYGSADVMAWVKQLGGLPFTSQDIERQFPGITNHVAKNRISVLFANGSIVRLDRGLYAQTPVTPAPATAEEGDDQELLSVGTTM